MAEEYIRIRGAREHNLRSIDLDIPREKLVVVTGLSGSGKSSLAFDTIFAEGQRRYVESLSAYARQFLGMLEKPDVDHIDGLSPAISIDQKGASRNPRSTVGTVTEVYDYLRLLFARIGVPHCPQCGREISQQTVQQMVDTLLHLPDSTRYMILAPIVQDRKGEYRQVFQDARQAGYVRVRVDGTVYDLEETPALDRYKQHTIEVVVDRLVNRRGDTDRTRVADSLETALRLGSGVVRVVLVDGAGRQSGENGNALGRHSDGSRGSDVRHSRESGTPDVRHSRESGNPSDSHAGDSENLPTRHSRESGTPDVRHSRESGNPSDSHAGDSENTPTRHSRESGSPSGGTAQAIRATEIEADASQEKMDSRFHGNDGKSGNDGKAGIDGESDPPTGRYPSASGTPDVRHSRKSRSPDVRHSRESGNPSGLHSDDSENTPTRHSREGGNPSDSHAGDSENTPTRHSRESGNPSGLHSDDSENTPTRHSRESGNPSGGTAQAIRATEIEVDASQEKMDSRFHGNDGQGGTDGQGGNDGRGEDDVQEGYSGQGGNDEIGGSDGRAGNYAQGGNDGQGRSGGENTGGNPEPVEILFSEQFACVHCGVSLGEVEPRTFSFNSPHGACPECTGIGTTMVFDPDLIAPNKRLSLLEGAILPWSRLGSKDTYLYQVVKAVGAKYGFSLSVPLAEIAPEHVDILLYGIQERLPVPVVDRFDKTRTFMSEFEGVIPNLERRHKQTDSDYMRQEIERFMTVQPCPACQGARLKPESLAVTLSDHTIAQVTAFAVKDARAWFEALPLSERERLIGRQILKEILARLHFLENVGLDYLTLDRATATLSGGEAQRIRLATQIGSGLVGVLYILDEPSIGLHQRDNRRLIATLSGLRDLGNSVLVVEHDEDTIRSADHVIDIGPGAGEYGGRVVAAGPLEDVMAVEDSLTAAFLTGKRQIAVPRERRGAGTSAAQATAARAEKAAAPPSRSRSRAQAARGADSGKAPGGKITVKGARANNLKSIDVSFPLGRFIGVTGVSGSGKSTLVIDVLYRRLAQEIYNSRERPGPHDTILGLDSIDKVIDINQQPIGRTPRSNPATYTGAFTPMRELFAKTPEARVRGYKPGRFSFNVKGGRCEACRGDGIITIEMQFLPDVYVPCEVCDGKRYNREALEVMYKGKTIAVVLDLTIDEAATFFENVPSIHNRFRTLVDVGLGYMRVGQPATTLSGGEAQRVKLAAELSKRATGRTLYILDEPTTGLHFADVERLLEVLQRLVDTGNTVIVIEHNLEVIKCVDWVIDLGPEGGDAGGELVAEGTPETLAHLPHSYTGVYLRQVLERDGALEKAHAS